MSLLFGTTPEAGPRIVRTLRTEQSDGKVTFDLDRHLTEVLAGVDAANIEFGGSLQLEAIMVITDDYPSAWQSKYVAYLIARHAITGENWPSAEPAPPE
jgi:hypothetical protein